MIASVCIERLQIPLLDEKLDNLRYRRPLKKKKKRRRLIQKLCNLKTILIIQSIFAKSVSDRGRKSKNGRFKQKRARIILRRNRTTPNFYFRNFIRETRFLHG